MANRSPVQQLALDTIATLRDVGSAATRTHIHKTIYMAARLRIIDHNAFPFVLHLYGPYSFELDQVLMDLVASGEVASQLGPGGMGSSFRTDRGRVLPELQKVASWLGKKGVRELEAVTTAAFVKDRGAQHPEQEVGRIKPHLRPSEIQQAFAELQDTEPALL